MTALTYPSSASLSPSSSGLGLPAWLASALRLWSAISGLWTTALLSAVPMSPARALDLGSSGDRNDETVAYRDRLKDYDNIKRYGAERVADRDRKQFQPDGIRAGDFVHAVDRHHTGVR